MPRACWKWRAEGPRDRSADCQGCRHPDYAAAFGSERKDEGGRNACRRRIARGLGFTCRLSANVASAATRQRTAGRKHKRERVRRARAICLPGCFYSIKPICAGTCRCANHRIRRHAANRWPRPLFVSQGCSACVMGLPAKGTHFAPSLIGVGKEVSWERFAYAAPPPDKQDARWRNADRKSQRRAIGRTRGILIQPRSSVRRHRRGPGQRTFNRACFQSGNRACCNKSAHACTAGRCDTAQSSRSARAESLPELLLRKLSWCRWSNRHRGCSPVGGYWLRFFPQRCLKIFCAITVSRCKKAACPLTNTLNAQDMKSIVAFIRSMPAKGQ